MSDEGVVGGAGMTDGYYWILCPADDTKLIAKLEDGEWYVPGVECSVQIYPDEVLCKVIEP